MEAAVLRTVKGGYNKKEVLMKADAYTSLLLAVEQGSLTDAAINAELEKIRSMPLETAKGGLFGKGSGFSQEDTDKYLAGLEEEIMSRLML